MAKPRVTQNQPISQLYADRVRRVVELLGAGNMAAIVEESEDRIVRWASGRGRVSPNNKRAIDQFFRVTGTYSAQLVAMMARAENLQDLMGPADYHAFVNYVTQYFLQKKKGHRVRPPVHWGFYRHDKSGPRDIGRAIVDLLMHYGLDPHNRPDTYVLMASTASWGRGVH